MGACSKCSADTSTQRWSHVPGEIGEICVPCHAQWMEAYVKKTTKPTKLTDGCYVASTDLFFMILGYVRYAVGRMSMAPSEAQAIIARYGHALEKSHLTQIEAEIARELARCERMNQPLGMDMDTRTWKATVVDIQRQLATRV